MLSGHDERTQENHCAVCDAAYYMALDRSCQVCDYAPNYVCPDGEFRTGSLCDTKVASNGQTCQACTTCTEGCAPRTPHTACPHPRFSTRAPPIDRTAAHCARPGGYTGLNGPTQVFATPVGHMSCVCTSEMSPHRRARAPRRTYEPARCTAC